MIRRRSPDLMLIALLFLLPLILFWQQTMGGRTLLPTENLYQYQPYAAYREVVKAPALPHNALLSDLVLQNMQWKEFIRQSIAAREIPLWNPHQFAGIPFLAAGQQSTLYPFSLIYYILPLPAAYGWFNVVQLWLAGVFMYAFLRGLGIGRLGALLAGIIYQLNGFFIAHAVFPMIVGAAVWLPLLLLMIEFTIQQKPAFGRPASVPWVIIGAIALGCNILAGHVEITYYTLLIAAYYAAARLVWLWWSSRKNVRTRYIVSVLFQRAVWLVTMVILGLGLGAVQFIPLFEFANLNYRQGSASLDQVLGWAHPFRDAVQFLMPNFYGNPSHHSYYDWFTGQTVPATVNALGQSINTIDWGMKNYVEGALYLGLLPLALAVFALVIPKTPPSNPLPVHGEGEPATPSNVTPYRWIFALLALVALTFMFGLPTYGVLFYVLPGFSQLHSPFRWIFAVTLSVAVLAGFGVDALVSLAGEQPVRTRYIVSVQNWARRFGWVLTIMGALILLALLVSRLLYPQIEPLVDRVLQSMAKAPEAFADARMFYNYEFTNVLVFGLMTLGAGVVFLLASRTALTPQPSLPHGEGEKTVQNHARSPLSMQWRAEWGRMSPEVRGDLGVGTTIKPWHILAIALTALDLMIASWNFNPASDPALLDFTPPAIQWLQGQPGYWRYITIDDPNQAPLFNANMTWRYGLDDVRGYESIIPKSYVDFMKQLAPQTQLEFNRVAPLFTSYSGSDFSYTDVLKSPLLSLLNVRYIITAKSVTLPDEFTVSPDPRRIPPAIKLAYEDEAVRIWDRGPERYAYVANLDKGERPELSGDYGLGFDVAIEGDTGREKVLHANLYKDVDSWLIVSETYVPGWRAFVRPRGGDDNTEKPLEVEPVFGNFQGMNLAPEVLTQTFSDTYDDLPAAQRLALDNRQVTVRLVYSPASFQIGLFGSVMAGVMLIFMLGVWLWQLFVKVGDSASGAAVVAKNSLAPIILNLFNRMIDFGLAFITLRILGPEGAGIYYYAGFIFVWFDIFTNFGLNIFLMREVSRHRAQAWRYLFNTSVLRLALAGIGIPLLVIFLAVRQSLPGTEPLVHEAVLALLLLYVGLFPNSLSTGLSALFYAFEKAEVPAAVTTVTTISRAVLSVIALTLGFGVVGLAGVSILTNLITLAVLAWNARELVALTPRPPLPQVEGEEEALTPDPSPSGRGEKAEMVHEQPARSLKPDIPMIRGMVGESWPFMLNHFLQHIFFQVDVVIIEAIHGARMVGQYSVAYKWISMLQIVPSFFTMALLPVMSRQAKEDRAALRRTYRLGIKLLVSLALPAAVLFTALAYVLANLLGGAEYLPDGAIATQLIIWSVPISWMNGLTQYVLIALDLQRRITWAFVLAVTFNIVANLIFVPEYGYRAAALVTIASEAVLFLPFIFLLHEGLPDVGWLTILWKPLAATGVMVGVFLIGWNGQTFLTLVIGSLAYVATLLALRPLDADEWARLQSIIPARLRRKVASSPTRLT